MENININANRVGSPAKSQQAQKSQNLDLGQENRLKPKQSNFMQKLEKIKSDDVRAKVESLYEKIIDKSNTLRDDWNFKGTLSLKGIVEYKNLVRDFMKLSSENSFVFSQKNFLDRRGKHRVQTTIKQVDRELEEITQEFVKSHIDHAKVLKNIDAIKGMLIDIMM